MVAAVVLASALGAEGALAGLAGVLAPPARAALQADLTARAAAWAAQVAPGRASVIEMPGAAARGEHIATVVAEAFERHGGPVLIAGTDVPRLSAAHAAVALADLEDGADASFGPSMDGGWYLAALARPRRELFELAGEVWDGPVVMARTLEVAQRLGLEVGLLRMERALRGGADLRAMLADPLSAPLLAAAGPDAKMGRGPHASGTPRADR